MTACDPPGPSSLRLGSNVPRAAPRLARHRPRALTLRQARFGNKPRRASCRGMLLRLPRPACSRRPDARPRQTPACPLRAAPRAPHGRRRSRRGRPLPTPRQSAPPIRHGRARAGIRNKRMRRRPRRRAEAFDVVVGSARQAGFQGGDTLSQLVVAFLALQLEDAHAAHQLGLHHELDI